MTSTGKECLKETDVYLPNNGIAFIDTDDEKGLKKALIHGGVDTEIYINCGGSVNEECKQMDVDASTSSFLKITMGSSSELIDNEIYCPIDSTYSGSEASSCIIDNSAGGTLEDVIVYAVNGWPADFYATGDDLNQITVDCGSSYGSSTSGNTLSGGTGDCYITSSPTNDPSKTPTNSPSSDNPTAAPTTNPTPTPTDTPTVSPTPSPTANPTINPTPSPTGYPSTSPTTSVPSISPSLYPTARPSSLPTITLITIYTICLFS